MVYALQLEVCFVINTALCETLVHSLVKVLTKIQYDLARRSGGMQDGICPLKSY